MRLLWGNALNSVYASGLGALVAVAAAVPVVLFTLRFPGRLSWIVERLAYTGFALPGIAVALALIFFGARFATPLYQTLGLLVFAYVVLFFPQAMGALRSTYMQVSPRLSEAALSLGHRPLSIVIRISLPLMVPGMLAGGALVFLTAMKELPATLLLSPIGYGTLATSIWSAAEEAFFAQAAVPALLLVAVSAVPTAFSHSPRAKERAVSVPAVQCTGVSKRFAGAEGYALQDLDLVAQSGNILALLGPSGSGKTTALRIIAGFESPDSGTVEIAGQRVAGPGRFVSADRRRIGMVFPGVRAVPPPHSSRKRGFRNWRQSRPRQAC